MTVARDYQLAVAQRFAQRLVAGDCVAQLGAASFAGFPCTQAEDAGVKTLSHVNALVTMQVMCDRGLTDPRFYTVAQIDKAGWRLREGAVGAGLQYLLRRRGEGGAAVKRFKVFHASDIDGIAPWEPATRLQANDIAAALVSEGDAQPALENLGGALAVWVEANVDWRAGETEDRAALRRMLVATWLEAESGVGLRAEERVSPARLAACVGDDPSDFYAVVGEAQRLASVLMERALAAQFEREAVTPASGRRQDMTSGKYLARIERLFAERQAVLAVPFAEKDRANDLGAVWHPLKKLWFVPAGLDLAQFKDWTLNGNGLSATASDAFLKSEFEKALAQLNLRVPPKGINADGAWHNVRVDVKKSNKSGAYVLDLLHPDGPRGKLSNKISGERRTWRYDGVVLTPQQRARLCEEARQREAAAKAEEQERQDQAALHAQEILASGVSAENHPYVKRKGVDGTMIRQVPGSRLLEFEEFIGESGKSAIRANKMYAIVPLTTERGEVRNLQAISPDGKIKAFMRGAQKKGLMYVLGAASFDALLHSDCPVLAYTEGFATGADFRAGISVPTVICFDAGNMETVVQATAKLLPKDTTKLLALDNDQYHVERAVEYVAEHCGVNPHGAQGGRVAVRSRADRAPNDGGNREVALGDVVANGEWQQGPKGRYCVRIEYEADGVVVRALKVETSVEGRRNGVTFVNRGAEVGHACAKAASGMQLLSPSFESVAGQPTDWNDLKQREGADVVKHQIGEAVGDSMWAEWWASYLNRPKATTIAEARGYADLADLLEAATTLKEVEALDEALNLAFVGEQIVMWDADWDRWTTALKSKCAALEARHVGAGCER